VYICIPYRFLFTKIKKNDDEQGKRKYKNRKETKKELLGKKEGKAVKIS